MKEFHSQCILFDRFENKTDTSQTSFLARDISLGAEFKSKSFGRLLPLVKFREKI